jgi:protein-S-isoprenylcysteine O-methyltransferase Ste14
VLAFLFRRRTFFLLVGMAALLAWARPRPLLYFVGLGLVGLGSIVRLWAAGTIHKAREVTVSGPYAWVRHPLYAGSFLIACGYFAMCGRWQAFAIGIPVFALFHWVAIVIEEEMLLALFSDEYAQYRRQAPAVIPCRRPAPAAGASFSWDRVLYNREPLHALGAAVLSGAFALLMILRR